MNPEISIDQNLKHQMIDYRLDETSNIFVFAEFFYPLKRFGEDEHEPTLALNHIFQMGGEKLPASLR